MNRVVFERRYTALPRDEKGVAFIEFALCIFFLLIMFYGTIELTRFILIVQKAEKTVDTLTDVITQAQSGELADGDVAIYLNAAQELMNPYTFGAKGNVILTDVHTGNDPSSPTVNWQVCAGGTLLATSTVSASGVPGSPATLPSTFTMNANEEAVIGELFYNFTPLLNQNVIKAANIYRVAVFKPRFASLSTTQTYLPCT